jgi:hypothetical protein
MSKFVNYTDNVANNISGNTDLSFDLILDPVFDSFFDDLFDQIFNEESTAKPTVKPTVKPTAKPAAKPTAKPVINKPIKRKQSIQNNDENSIKKRQYKTKDQRKKKLMVITLKNPRKAGMLRASTWTKPEQFERMKAALWEMKFLNSRITDMSKKYKIPIRTLRRRRDVVEFFNLKRDVFPSLITQKTLQRSTE